MHLSKVNEALNHKIVGGDEYQWECYGPNARYLDYESQYAHASVIFNTMTQEIYEATVSSKDENVKLYRWLEPDTKQLFINECKRKKIDPNLAWDTVHYVDLETVEDFLDKAEAIFNGETFDTRIQVPLELERDELYELMSMAHERDITLNEMVEEILWRVINTEKNPSVIK